MKILIDNGSNNNFIKPSVAEKLDLKRTPIAEFKVGTGSGEFLLCDSKCKNVLLSIQGHEFVTNLFVLEIKGAEVVLGVQRVIDLGTVKTNYKDLTKEFSYGGKEVKLQGGNILINTSIRRKKINKNGGC